MFGIKRRKGNMAPESDPTSIGNLAVERNLITQDDLASAVNVQKERLPIGKILIEMGKLTEEQVTELLFEQKVLRGEVKNKNVIAQFETDKRRRRVDMVRASIKEAGQEVKKIASSMTTSAEAAKAK